MVLDDDLERVPHVLDARALDHFARVFNVGGNLEIDQTLHNKRLKQLERHFLGQAALIHLQLRPDDDNGTARIVDTLTEQVLTETSLFALEHIGQRLERAVARPCDRAAAAAVVDQRVDRLLEHTLFVAHDDVGRAKLQQLLQTVVAVDDTAVQVVEVARCKTAAVELNHRADIRRNNRHNIQDHPLGPVVALAERLDHLKALEQFDALLASSCFKIRFQFLRKLVEIQLGQQLLDRLRPHAGAEIVLIRLLEVAVFLFGKQRIFFKIRNARIDDNIRREIEHLLQQARRHIEQQPHAAARSLEVPDMRNRRSQLDVAHALAAHLGARDLDAAAFADLALVADALVTAAIAFPVLRRSKDLFAEQPFTLRLEGAVVDGFRLLNLAPRPLADKVRRRQSDFYRFKYIKFQKRTPLFFCKRQFRSFCWF